MSTEVPAPDPDEPSSQDGGWTFSYRRYLSRQYLMVALAVYLVSALFGFYANWKFWSYFDVQYLRYAGPTDYLLAPVSFLKILVDPSFIVVFVMFGSILLLVVGCCGYLFRVIRDYIQYQYASPGKAPEPTSNSLPFLDHWHDHRPFRSYLRALAGRPLWAAPILAIAVVLAINVNATAEKSDLRSFAKLIQHAYAKDRYQRLRPPYSRYELVSVGMLTPTERRQHLVRLRSTDNFVLYYDVLDDEPVVVASDRVSSEVADASLVDPAPPTTASDEPSTQLAEAGGATTIRTAEGSSDRGAPDGVKPPGARGGITDLTLPLPSTAAQPTDGLATSTQIAPAAVAGERAAPGQSPNPEAILATDTAPRDAPGSSATRPPAQPPGPKAQGITTLPERPSVAAGAATPHTEFDAIATNVRQSQGSLDGLKSYLQQMETSFVEIHKFINELDGSLKDIDQAFDQLAKQEAAGEQGAYGDCPELTAGQPIEFGADDATLSLEAVGWLFKSRHQLTAQRSADRRQWLVIEGHANVAPQPAAEPPLAIRRANAVRDFLQSELGVAPAAMKVVGKGVSGPGARFVSLYDCLERQPAAAPPATAATTTPSPTITPVATTTTATPAKLGLVQSAMAGEVGGTGTVRPAAWKPGEDTGGLAAMLAYLEPRFEERGLLVTVPGDRLFDTDSSRIESSAYAILSEIGDGLTREPERRALIVGHSDALGDAAYNRVLSERRARAVRDFLVDNFKIASDRLSVEGRGEDEPIATNDTQAGRLANRRVEVVILN